MPSHFLVKLSFQSSVFRYTSCVVTVDYSKRRQRLCTLFRILLFSLFIF